MRNLKRALSLTLASIMLLGMMVVGSGAASYKDITDDHNVEAIEVLQAVGIMVGDDGNFNPDKNVTRNEMAVIMSNLMDYRVASYAGTSPFTDVPSWAEPYVAACYTNGITSGTSATTYNGSGNVTTAQAALMVMKALGYFQYADDFGDDWQLETTRQAGKIDLLVDVEAPVKSAMTRNDVAQLVLNGLKSGMVEADDSNKINVSVGEAQVSVGGTNYVYVTSREKYAEAIKKDKLVNVNATSTSALSAPIVELGEKLYQGSLTLKSYIEDTNFDDFGRPANTWAYQSKEIGTYAEEPDYVFTAGVTPKAMYNAVGTTAAEKYTWMIKNNGENVWLDAPAKGGFPGLVAQQTVDSGDFYKKGGLSSDKLYGTKDELTGNGVLTEVYVDGTLDKETVIVAVTDFYAAEVYQVKDGQVTLSNIESEAPALTSDEFTSSDFEEDEIVYYSYAKGKIQSMAAADRIEGEVTKVVANTSDVNGKNFDLDGETNYKYLYTMDTGDALITDNVANNMVGYTMTLGDKAYCMYIDWAAVTYDYAYVLSMGTDSDKADSSGANDTVWARLVLTDGSMITVETDAKAPVAGRTTSDIDKLLNHVVSYSKNSNGVYTLRAKDNGEDKTTLGTDGPFDVPGGVSIFENGRSKITNADGNWTANNNTIFIVGESGDTWSDWSFSVYTGVENIPDIDARAANTKICVAATDKGIAKVVYVQDADVSGNGNVIFVVANSGADVQLQKDGTRFYNLTAYENGEKLSDFNVKYDSDAYDKLVGGIGDFQDGTVTGTPVNNADRTKATKFAVPVRVVTRNSDGLVTNVKFYEGYTAANKTGVIAGVQTTKNQNGAVGLTGHGSWYVLNDARQVRYDTFADVYSVAGIGSVKDSKCDTYIGVVEDNDLIGLFVVDWPETGAVGGYDVNVYVNGELNTTLSKSGVEDGKTYEFVYTVTTGETASYKIGTAGTSTKVPADGKIVVSGKEGDVIEVYITTVEAGVGEFTILGNVPVNYKVTDAGSDTVIQFWITDANWPDYVPQDGKIKGIAHTEIAGAATRDIAGDGDNDTSTTIDLEYSKKTSVLISSWKFNTESGMTIVGGDKTGAATNNFAPDKVIVEVKVPAGYEQFISSGTSEDVVVTNSTGTNITVKLGALANTITNDIKWTMTGADATSTKSGTATAGDNTITIADVKADGNKKVVVELTGMDKLKSGVTIGNLAAAALGTGTGNLGYTGKLSDAAKAYTLKIEASKTTCEKDETIILTATLSNNLLKASEKVGLKVTATVCGQEVEFIFANTGTTTAAGTATANIKATVSDEITAADLKFTDIEAPTVKSIAAIDLGTANEFDVGDQIIITFSEPVTKSSVTPTVTGTSATTTVASTWDTGDGETTGTELTLTLNNANPPSDGKLNIAAEVENADGVLNIEAIQFELPGGAGKFTPTLKPVTAP